MVCIGIDMGIILLGIGIDAGAHMGIRTGMGMVLQMTMTISISMDIEVVSLDFVMSSCCFSAQAAELQHKAVYPHVCPRPRLHLR